MTFIPYSKNTIFYEEHGEGEAILLLQGNTASCVSFHATGDVNYFSQFGRVITLDFLGTGKSERLSTWPVDWYVKAAEQAHFVIRACNISGVKVIGSSGGALIGFWFAILYPQLVKCLIADSFSLDYKQQMQYVVKRTRQNYSPEQIAFWQHNHGEDWQQVIEADTDFLSRYAQAQVGDYVDIPLEKIQCPVLITGSREDDMIPCFAEQAEISANRIESAKVYLHPSGTHPFMWSESHAFREQVRFFWK